LKELGTTYGGKQQQIAFGIRAGAVLANERGDFRSCTRRFMVLPATRSIVRHVRRRAPHDWEIMLDGELVFCPSC
jgi:hypothetical protein